MGLILRQAARGDVVSAVIDKVGSPTFAPHVAGKILDMSLAQTEGIRHLVNAGAATRHAFAARVLDQFGYTDTVTPITSEAFPSLVRRPAYSALSTIHADAKLPPWQDAVDELAKTQHSYGPGRRSR